MTARALRSDLNQTLTRNTQHISKSRAWFDESFSDWPKHAGKDWGVTWYSYFFRTEAGEPDPGKWNRCHSNIPRQVRTGPTYYLPISVFAKHSFRFPAPCTWADTQAAHQSSDYACFKFTLHLFRRREFQWTCEIDQYVANCQTNSASSKRLFQDMRAQNTIVRNPLLVLKRHSCTSHGILRQVCLWIWILSNQRRRCFSCGGCWSL